MVSESIWLFNVRPNNWRRCVDGPPQLPAHGDHTGHPWHGLNNRTAWAARKMEKGQIAIVRQSQHGVMGIWEINETAPIESQEDHEWPEDYNQFVYCRALERELEPPLKDTEFLHHHDFARFNAGANQLSNEDAETFLIHLLERPDLSQAAAVHIHEVLEQLDATISQPSEDMTNESDTGTFGSSGEGAIPDALEQSSDLSPPERTETTVSRVIRNTRIVKDLKEQYEHTCQVCGKRRQRARDEPYAEGHHLHPLGDDPPGKDHRSNIIILCPNHHADFDYGVIEIDPETLEIAHAYESELTGQYLFVEDDHNLKKEYLEYHASQISVV